MNKETLIILRSNFDKPEIMKEHFKRLQHVDNVLQRMTIIGVILSFRQLLQEALLDVLEQRIPFLVSSMKDFQNHVPGGDPLKTVSEMASAAGLNCKVDPTLLNALRAQKPEIDDGEHLIVLLLMVFVAVSIPKLSKNDQSFYRATFEAHTNNTHCMALAVNNIFGALFTICGQNDIEDRMAEFLALASSSLLRLGQETEKENIKNRESIYLLLHQIVQESPFLTMVSELFSELLQDFERSFFSLIGPARVLLPLCFNPELLPCGVQARAVGNLGMFFASFNSRNFFWPAKCRASLYTLL